MQIDVDIGSSSVARSVIGLVLGYVTSLVVDLAILIEVCASALVIKTVYIIRAEFYYGIVNSCFSILFSNYLISIISYCIDKFQLLYNLIRMTWILSSWPWGLARCAKLDVDCYCICRQRKSQNYLSIFLGQFSWIAWSPILQYPWRFEDFLCQLPFSFIIMYTTVVPLF